MAGSCERGSETTKNKLDPSTQLIFISYSCLFSFFVPLQVSVSCSGGAVVCRDKTELLVGNDVHMGLKYSTNKTAIKNKILCTSRSNV